METLPALLLGLSTGALGDPDEPIDLVGEEGGGAGPSGSGAGPRATTRVRREASPWTPIAMPMVLYEYSSRELYAAKVRRSRAS